MGRDKHSLTLLTDRYYSFLSLLSSFQSLLSLFLLDSQFDEKMNLPTPGPFRSSKNLKSPSGNEKKERIVDCKIIERSGCSARDRRALESIGSDWLEAEGGRGGEAKSGPVMRF